MYPCARKSTSKSILRRALRLPGLALCMTVLLASAAYGTQSAVIHHQGLLKVNSVPFTGNGEFRFSLVDTQTGLNVWTNDGSAIDVGDAPTLPVTLPVAIGLYEVGLGDTSLPNMNAVTDDLFSNGNLALRVWFDDGVNGMQQLAPDQDIGVVPYAARAINADRATLANHATAADTAVQAEHATLADTATQTPHADHATLADTATLATDASHAAAADTAAQADHATLADSATQTPHADHATLADTATLATNAAHATAADTAAQADHATLADNATQTPHADHATLADTATLATNAAHATAADTAAQADHATLADSATQTPHADRATLADTATLAENAVHAEDASTLQGVPPTELEESVEITAAVAAHTAIPDAHHAKTVDASELTQGLLDDARLSPNVSLLGSSIEAIEIAGELNDASIPPTIARDTEISSAIDAHRTDASTHTNLLVDGAHITGTVPDARIDGSLARDAEVTAAVTAHNGLSNAHTALLLDGAQIAAGKVANARLNTGAGNGLDADTVDGYQASAFMPIGTDNWVNTTGDSMSAASGTVLSVTNTSTGTAIQAQAAGSSNAALVANSTGSSGQSVLAQATGATAAAVDGRATSTAAGPNYGGKFSAAGTNGFGVQGTTSGANGKAGDFTASGSGNAVGVQGYASSTAAVTNHGGYFTAAGTTGRGVYGKASSAGAYTNSGGYFEAAGDTGRGVYGEALSTNQFSVSYGVVGKSASGQGIGVRGESSGFSAIAVNGYASGSDGKAGYFFADGDGSNALGVQGVASSTAAVTNHGGYFTAAGTTGIGVFGSATNAGNYINYGGNFEAAGAISVGVRGESPNVGVRGYANAASGVGVAGMANYSGGRGVTGYGASDGYDFYAHGPGANYGAFTGAHEVKLAAGFSAQCVAGLVLSATGETQVRKDEQGDVSLSSTLPTVRLADTPNDKAVFGVLIAETPLPRDHWFKPAEGDRFATANALGEGRVWVTNANGNIALGDYITTSAVPGYGQLQNDDLLHNYTLGKVTEYVDWSAVTETVESGGHVYKAHLIAVVYVSG